MKKMFFFFIAVSLFSTSQKLFGQNPIFITQYSKANISPLSSNINFALYSSYFHILLVKKLTDKSSLIPVANPDTYTMNEDETLTTTALNGVLVNDTDAITAQLAAPFAGPGTLIFNTNGTFTYQPPANFNNTSLTPVTFQYTATNAMSQTSAPATVSIVVNPVNDPPVISGLPVGTQNLTQNDTLTNTVYNFTVISGPADESTQTLIVTASALPTGKIQNLNVTPTGGNNYTLSFRPISSQFGTVTITVTATDNGSGISPNSNTFSQNINLNITQVIPTANNDTYITNEDTPLNIAAPGVLQNDQDALSVELLTPPPVSEGIVTLNPNGSFTFTPAPNFFGAATFSYRAKDVSDFSPNATVSITVNPVNDPPVISGLPTTHNLTQNDTITNTVFNFTVVPGPPNEISQTLTVTATALPTGKIQNLTVTPTGGNNYTLSFRPISSQFGPVTITVTATDNGSNIAPNVNSSSQNISLNISQVIPQSVNDTYSTNEDTPLIVNAPGVLSNDLNGPLTAQLVQTTTNGVLVLNVNGGFTYTPNANFVGNDFFTYQAKDVTDLSPIIARVDITINAVNDPPVISGLPVGTQTLSQNDTLTNTVYNFTVISGPPNESSQTLTVTATALPTGKIQNLTVTPTGGNNYALSFRPISSQFGTVTITVTATDNGSNVAPNDNNSSQIVVLNITQVIPIANNDSYTTNEDTPLTIAAPGVLQNDQFALTAVLTVPPIASQGSVTLNATGGFTFTPAPNFFGAATFKYRARDVSDLSNEATVTITVNPVNDPPTLNLQSSFTLDQDQTAVNTNVPFSVGPGPLETQNLVIAVTGIVPNDILDFVDVNPKNIASANGANNAVQLSIRPKADRFGTVRITIQVTDAVGLTNSKFIDIIVSEVPPIPPSNLVANNVGSDRIDLTWTDNSPNEVGFRIERAGSLAGPYDVIVATLGPNVTSFSNTGLKYNTQFCYRVVAFNSTGTGISNGSCDRTDNVLPATPSNVSADQSQVIPNQMDVSWLDNSDNEDGFEIYRSSSETGLSNYAFLTSVPANTLIYADQNLNPGVRYCYKVRAFNEIGLTIFTPENQGCDIIPNAPPNASPTNLRTTTLSGYEIQLDWNESSSNETGFIVERALEGTSTFMEIHRTRKDVIQYVDLNLNPNTSYCYRVRAFNLLGLSQDYTNISCSRTLEVPPRDPTSLIANAVSSRQINLFWSDNANNETGFKLERSIDGNTNFVEIAVLPSNTTSFSDRNLLSEKQYCYRIRAYNVAGNSNYSNESCTSTFVEKPENPGDLTVTAISSSQINITWNDRSDNEQGFILERSMNNNSNFTAIATIDRNNTSYADRNLRYNTTYCYRINAFNQAGNSSFSNEACTSTFQAPPAAPDLLTAKALDSSTEIELNWSDNSDNENGFIVYRSDNDNSNYFEIIKLAANVTTFIDTRLKQNSNYCYKVQSYNEINVSSFTNEVCEYTTYNAILLPNTFTPNGDGKNDRFVLRSRNIAEVTFNVYDKFGNLIYNTNNVNEATDPLKGWDGGNYPNGTYVCVVTVKYVNGETVKYNGKINLIR